MYQTSSVSRRLLGVEPPGLAILGKPHHVAHDAAIDTRLARQYTRIAFFVELPTFRPPFCQCADSGVSSHARRHDGQRTHEATVVDRASGDTSAGRERVTAQCTTISAALTGNSRQVAASYGARLRSLVRDPRPHLT
jgi:hypothetical protein